MSGDYYSYSSAEVNTAKREYDNHFRFLAGGTARYFHNSRTELGLSAGLVYSCYNLKVKWLDSTDYRDPLFISDCLSWSDYDYWSASIGGYASYRISIPTTLTVKLQYSRPKYSDASSYYFTVWYPDNWYVTDQDTWQYSFGATLTHYIY